MTTLHPLLPFALARVRTLRVAVGGRFLTRLAADGMPFLLPLLYQVGLGYTPVQATLTRPNPAPPHPVLEGLLD